MTTNTITRSFPFLPQFAKKGDAFEVTKVILDEILNTTTGNVFFVRSRESISFERKINVEKSLRERKRTN